MADIVYLVRHAAPPLDRQGRYWGRGDPGVDPASLDEAASIAALAWEPPRRLLSSPLRRTAATADRLSERLGLPVEIAPELVEADFGDFDGLTFSEIESLHPIPAREWSQKGDAFSFPRGESVQHFLDRAAHAWERCCGLPESAVMAVTHGGIIACWCCLFLRMSFEHRFAFRPEYAALTAFIRKKDGSGWELAFFNNRV